MNKDQKNRAELNILGTYKRLPVEFSHGKNVFLYDTDGKEYLDLGGGIAVNALGHAHPEVIEALQTQAKKFCHVSNQYYTEPQITLAEKINQHMKHSGKVFFCNSGAEANECMIKLARKHGNIHAKQNIITAKNSFHGRTFGGMSATGQDKIKDGFTPLLDSFYHIPYNSIEALDSHINEKTAALIIEGIQGEGGVIPATPEFLLHARKLCTKYNALLCIDAVQCGFFRSGTFQSYTKILSDTHFSFKPDAVAHAKSLGGGFPIGAVWISDAYKDVLSYGNHGSTYGGNPLACAVSGKIFEIIERDNIQDQITHSGSYLLENLSTLKNKYPHVIKDIRGLGLMIGIELQNISIPDTYTDLSVASYTTLKALEDHQLTLIPSGTHVLRILPAYTITKSDLDLGLEKLERLLKQL